ncbi:MAG: hypothetical protein L0312_25125 [Acidobacteria bacterium]|nr:hypothetical protein [Acidobacteriota bacterium]
MSHQVYQKSLADHLAKWQKRRSRRLTDDQLQAALLLLRLDLEVLRPELEKLYSPSPRGRQPRDPVLMLRALILMLCLGYEQITRFAKDLRLRQRLALISGFEPLKTPSVGAFYLFIDRLEDGPFEPNCPHRLKPSQVRKKPRLRNLHQEKADKETQRAQILAQSDSITGQLKDDLLQLVDQPRAQDFLSRLEDILIKSAVIPSAHRGLLGDLNQLVVCGDGSALVSGSSPYGKASCHCRQEGIFRCDHPRFYCDHTANWGWDSYREVFYFGHTFYQHIVNFGGHDLPVHLNISQASESDFTLSLKSLDRFIKAAREHQLEMIISAAVYDSGHDGRGNYEYLLAKKIDPVIVLNPRHGLPQASGTAARIAPNGVPICPAGLEMRRHSSTPNHRIYFNCPVKRPTHLDGKTVWQSHVDQCPQLVLCQPDSKMGPIVYVRSDSDPRLYPKIARDSSRFKELMNLRSGCERSNAVKKTVHKLERRPCRSATHFLVRLYLVSILEHVKAWVAEDRKRLGDDWQALSDPEKIRQMSTKLPA